MKVWIRHSGNTHPGFPVSILLGLYFWGKILTLLKLAGLLLQRALFWQTSLFLEATFTFLLTYFKCHWEFELQEFSGLIVWQKGDWHFRLTQTTVNSLKYLNRKLTDLGRISNLKWTKIKCTNHKNNKVGLAWRPEKSENLPGKSKRFEKYISKQRACSWLVGAAAWSAIGNKVSLVSTTRKVKYKDKWTHTGHQYKFLYLRFWKPHQV